MLRRKKALAAKAEEEDKMEVEEGLAKEEESKNSEQKGVTTRGGMKLLGIGGKSSGGTTVPRGVKKKTPGELRVQKDIGELDSGKVGTVTFPNPNDLTHFTLDVVPDSGYWQAAKYNFTFNIPADYPHKPPKVLCHTKIYHPNIDLQGNVCLNILREDWKPVLDINAVIYGLIYLFYEPNTDDPLNNEAAASLRNDKNQFGRIVKRTMQGQSHGGESFPRLV
jgi:ubiquitin-conjugating enzyme E2 M